MAAMCAESSPPTLSVLSSYNEGGIAMQVGCVVHGAGIDPTPFEDEYLRQPVKLDADGNPTEERTVVRIIGSHSECHLNAVAKPQ